MIADITKYLFFNAKLPPTHMSYYFSISMNGENTFYANRELTVYTDYLSLLLYFITTILTI